LFWITVAKPGDLTTSRTENRKEVLHDLGQGDNESEISDSTYTMLSVSVSLASTMRSPSFMSISVRSVFALRRGISGLNPNCGTSPEGTPQHGTQGKVGERAPAAKLAGVRERTGMDSVRLNSVKLAIPA
jgi:hypothetical protein